ncbi:TIMM10B family protein [Megaselia abdita]
MLYNKITEMCFNQCVDNVFNRDVAEWEGSCVDKCVNKFARFNQKMMSVYVEVQTNINAKRMQEAEAVAAANATASAATDQVAVTANTPS